MDYNTRPYFYGTGRRKKSVARVRLYAGTGKVTINGRDIDDYFGLETLKLIVRQPMELTDTLGRFDIECNVAGGGISGQAGAIRHGLSRALLQVNEEAYRPILKKAGFGILTEYNEEGITNAIKALKARKEEWKCMGERAESVYTSSYSWEIMKQRIAEMYREL